jgi:hypothetical protein
MANNKSLTFFFAFLIIVLPFYLHFFKRFSFFSDFLSEFSRRYLFNFQFETKKSVFLAVLLIQNKKEIEKFLRIVYKDRKTFSLLSWINNEDE